MNVQGCHTLLAICFTYRVEDHDAFRLGAPYHFSLFIFKAEIQLKRLAFNLFENKINSPPTLANYFGHLNIQE